LLNLPEYRDCQTVLDVGCGEGLQARAFAEAGKHVTAVDLGRSPYWKKGSHKVKFDEGERFPSGGLVLKVRADVRSLEGGTAHDLIWASHVLEHQRDVGAFLSLLRSLCRPNGVLAITVPPRKDELVGGHLSTWSPARLIYNMVVAGIDCRQARVSAYGYDISVIVRNVSVPDGTLDGLCWDNGDINALGPWFPWAGVKERFAGFPGDANWPGAAGAAA
jgi:SAM-dependent methyltransferase